VIFFANHIKMILILFLVLIIAAALLAHRFGGSGVAKVVKNAFREFRFDFNEVKLSGKKFTEFDDPVFYDEFDAPRKVKLPTGIEHYSEKNKINAVYNTAPLPVKFSLLYLLMAESQFKLNRVDELRTISDKEFIKKYVVQTETYEEDLKLYAKNEAETLYATFRMLYPEIIPVKNYLDLGGDVDFFSKTFGALLDAENISCIDVNHRPKDYVFAKGVENIPWDENFSLAHIPDESIDVITMMYNFGKVCDDPKFLAEVRRILSPTGCVILREHNIKSCWDVMVSQLNDYIRTNGKKKLRKKTTYLIQ